MKDNKLKQKVQSLKAKYQEFYHEEAEDVFTSPGRMELVGNHTDHNHGLVMVSSVDLCITAVAKKTDDGIFVYHTPGFPDIRVDINDLTKREKEISTSLGMIRGVLFKMKEMGYKIGGAHVSTTTTIFKGAGVSSSAAFELLIAQIVNHYYNDDVIEPYVLASIAQFSECEYFGKPCGLLDQSGIALGGVNYIDFNDPKKPIIKHITCKINKYDVILVNTKDNHSALTPLYAKIKDDMFTLAHHFNKEVLRDVDEKEFFAAKEELIAKYGEGVFLRGKHYFEENARVRKAFNAISNGDEDTFVKTLGESGDSSFYQLKNCYVKDTNENLPKAILLSKKIINNGSVRVHGGGFAGTIIALVDKKEAKNYIDQMKKVYGNRNVKKILFSPYGTRYVSSVSEVING